MSKKGSLIGARQESKVFIKFSQLERLAEFLSLTRKFQLCDLSSVLHVFQIWFSEIKFCVVGRLPLRIPDQLK